MQRARGLLGLFALWLVCSAPHVTCAQAARLVLAGDVYGELIDGAVEEFTRGRFEEARTLFERAHAVQPNARALRGLGMCDFNLRAYARATYELEAALDSSLQPLDADLRAQVEALLLRAQPFVARITLRLSPADAALTVDHVAGLRDREGRLLLDLGAHVVQLEARGHLPREQALTLRSGGPATLELAAQPIVVPAVTQPPRASDSPRRRRQRVWRRAVLGAGVLALTSALSTGLRAGGRFRELEQRCRARLGCLPQEIDTTSIDRLDRATYVTVGLGGALLSAAFVMWMVDPAAWRTPTSPAR